MKHSTLHDYNKIINSNRNVCIGGLAPEFTLFYENIPNQSYNKRQGRGDESVERRAELLYPRFGIREAFRHQYNYPNLILVQEIQLFSCFYLFTIRSRSKTKMID